MAYNQFTTKDQIQTIVFEEIQNTYAPGNMDESDKDTALFKNYTLSNDLGLDSIEIVELGTKMEQEFTINLSDNVVEEWVTVNDVIESIYKELQS